VETWVLYLILLNSSTGEEESREALGSFDEIVMCMKAGMEYGAITKPVDGKMATFRCAKTVYAKQGPTT
jgi:hypothetical protein